MTSRPFFSIVTVSYNDAWSMMKTARSVFEQSFEDFEYIIVDGASKDGSAALMQFWQAQGLVNKAVSEPDTGVYDAMNKGLRLASGKYVCFLNSSDVFAHSGVLELVHNVLKDGQSDGALGWGELNDQIWASWIEDEAFKMASLGFCHQSLYVKRELLLEHPFDDRKFKTDSDTLQLGRLFGAGARIPIIAEPLAKRGGEPGISADAERTKISIRATLTEEYEGLSDQDANDIIDFRRSCADPDRILGFMKKQDRHVARHVAIMVLDTMFQKSSVKLSDEMCDELMRTALEVLDSDDQFDTAEAVERLRLCQIEREAALRVAVTAKRDLDRAVAKFQSEESRRIEKLYSAAVLKPDRTPTDLVISLTSFPARLKTVHFAIRSLLEQTCRPKEIHLWLGKDEVPGARWLPSRLRELEEHGLKIHFSDRTFHQYDKFMHNADLNERSPFVIVDDDVIYPPTALEALYDAHQKYPDAIIGNRCHWVAMDDAGGTLAPYQDWTREVTLAAPSERLMATGAGGVLYPKGFLTTPEVTDRELILSKAPYADDIWLKICAMARGIPTFATNLSKKGQWYHRYTPSMRDGTLMATNVERGLNDNQIQQCLKWLDDVRPDWAEDLRRGEMA
ncbi:glycosyltransferase [Nioella sp.]|uniref:glycosyltransferase n=1 Tax=Nioella sp. TaxID=1912091 RepID=UPI003A87BCAC